MVWETDVWCSMMMRGNFERGLVISSISLLSLSKLLSLYKIYTAFFCHYLDFITEFTGSLFALCSSMRNAILVKTTRDISKMTLDECWEALDADSFDDGWALTEKERFDLAGRVCELERSLESEA